MDIQTEKLGLIEWITRLSDQKVIDKLKMMMNAYQFESISEMTVAEQESILRGLNDFENGKTHSHDEARKILGKM
jgi:hypothetical protein